MRNFLSRIFLKDRGRLQAQCLSQVQLNHQLLLSLVKVVEEMSKVRQRQDELKTQVLALEVRLKRAETALLPLRPLGPNGVQELHLPSELRLDLSEVQSLIPLEKRINISEDS